MPNNIGYSLWLEAVKKIPSWEWTAGILTLCGAIFLFAVYQIFLLYELDIFHAFEKIKLKQKDLDAQANDTLYFEITIPKNSQTTAFQIQQKILKAFHSVYSDPIEGPHEFSNLFYFFQKLFRYWKVRRAKQSFFTMQVWAQYPYISLRLSIPKAFFQRVEKAIFNAYPNAEITMLEKSAVLAEVAKHQKSYLSYGQSTIEGLNPVVKTAFNSALAVT